MAIALVSVAAFFFLLGFLLLFFGAHLLVRGAASLAKKTGISETVMGLTIFAFGTSAPEFMTSAFASIGGYEEIVFGNIIGSNMFNLLLTIGVCAITAPLVIRTAMVRRQAPFSLAVTLLFIVLVNDSAMFGASENALSRLDGGLLLLGGLQAFLVFILVTLVMRRASSARNFGSRLPDLFMSSRDDDDPAHEEEDRVPDVRVYGAMLSIVMALGGLIAIVSGGWLVVRQSVVLADMVAVHQRLFALTIVAIGTSLPELLVSWRATQMRRPELAVANVVGSNIFNILGFMGISGIIRAAPYSRTFNADLLILAAATLAFHLLTQHRKPFGRRSGIAFLAAYCCYLAFVVIRH